MLVIFYMMMDQLYQNQILKKDLIKPSITCMLVYLEVVSHIQKVPSIRTYTGSVGIKGILDVHFQSGAFVKTKLILFFTTIFCEESVPTNNMVSLKLGPKRA